MSCRGLVLSSRHIPGSCNSQYIHSQRTQPFFWAKNPWRKQPKRDQQNCWKNLSPKYFPRNPLLRAEVQYSSCGGSAKSDVHCCPSTSLGRNGMLWCPALVQESIRHQNGDHDLKERVKRRFLFMIYTILKQGSRNIHDIHQRSGFWQPQKKEISDWEQQLIHHRIWFQPQTLFHSEEPRINLFTTMLTPFLIILPI